MPMPHAEMKRLIQRRLRGTDGAERLRVARECLALLPRYKQGPYADLRKWLLSEIEVARKRRDARHSDGAFVPRDGDARIVLLGPPNAGKSSLLKSLCGSSVQVGDYAFTTQRPIAATLLLNDARIQLVEIPGLIEGAREDKGSGRMYLGAAQDADGYLLVLPLEGPETGGLEAEEPETEGHLSGEAHTQACLALSARLQRFLAEVEAIFTSKRHLVAATKADLPGAKTVLKGMCSRFPECTVVPVSMRTGEGLQDLKAAIWEMTGLMRVYSKQSTEDRPFIVPRGLTV